MDEPAFFTKLRVLFIGLGLMGGSLALALKGKVSWMGGVDSSPKALEQASQMKIFDNLSLSIQDLVPETDVIILAAPVRQNIKILKVLPTLTARPTIIMDLGSTKREIVQAMQSLPDNFDPMGGHPMCGSEKSSILYASAAIFENARFIITPLERTSPKGMLFAQTLASVIKSNPYQLDAENHDRMASDISHFPYILSSALCLSTPLESKPLISTGFNSTSRLAGSSSSMMMDILLSNRDNVLNSLAAFKEQLNEFEAALIANDAGRLNQLVLLANEKHQQLLH